MTNSAVDGASISFYATALNASTGNSIVNLYNPYALTASTAGGSSWTTLTTQDATPVAC